MTPAHTPGPWELVGVMNGDEVMIIKGGLTDERPNFARTTAVNGGPGCIARIKLPHAGMVEIDNPSEQGANAQLIAAAPDMLAALQALALTLQRRLPGTPESHARAVLHSLGSSPNEKREAEAILALCAALEKATGEATHA